MKALVKFSFVENEMSTSILKEKGDGSWVFSMRAKLFIAQMFHLLGPTIRTHTSPLLPIILLADLSFGHLNVDPWLEFVIGHPFLWYPHQMNG